MTVKVDREAKSLIRLLDDWEDVNNEILDGIVDRITGESNSAASIITNRFERDKLRQRTYTPLKALTVKVKDRKGEQKLMQSTGRLKKSVQKTMSHKAGRKNVVFTANVPKYGELHQKGSGNLPQRKFFDLDQKAELNSFKKVAQTEFNKALAKNGLKLSK